MNDKGNWFKWEGRKAKSNKEALVDPYVSRVVEKYESRSAVGIKKYGTTLERKDLSTLDWLIHAQEEAMDMSLYLQVLIDREKELKK